MSRLRAEQGKVDVDFSLSLLNRTGAYYISKDLIANLRPLLSSVRCWRLPPSISIGDGLPRKIVARLMLAELRAFRESSLFPVSRPASKTLYLDPLYVLRAKLTSSDIVLCHDVGPLTHSELFEPQTVAHYRDAYRKIARIGPGIVFVSSTSKREFVRLFKERFRFLRVITLYPRRAVRIAEPVAVTGVDGPFILAVGAMEERKNYLRCIEAFSKSELAATHQFVICGPRGNATAAVVEAAASHPRVRALGAVSDGELSWLYERATGFLLPSLLEGFGVPVIEAAEQGLVCVASAGSAQEEALGGHGIFVDPTDITSISAGLTQLLKMSSQERAGYVTRSREHIASLTLERFVGEWRELLLQEHALLDAAFEPGCMAEPQTLQANAVRR